MFTRFNTKVQIDTSLGSKFRLGEGRGQSVNEILSFSEVWKFLTFANQSGRKTNLCGTRNGRSLMTQTELSQLVIPHREYSSGICNRQRFVSRGWKRKVGGKRYKARSRGRSCPDTLAF